MTGYCFIVRGSQGEYEDAETWVVAVFRSKEDAEERATKAKARNDVLAKELNETYLTLHVMSLTYESEFQYARDKAKASNALDSANPIEADKHRIYTVEQALFIYEKEAK